MKDRSTRRSRILHKMGVKEIGLKSAQEIGKGILGMGVIAAIFQC